jgi:hypothetical protein
MMMTKRLEILKNSLEKKEKSFDDKFSVHKEEVNDNQCEPLNDGKRGSANLRRWEKTNDALRTMYQGIEKTKSAIEREESKIEDCALVAELLPQEILDLLENGTLKQWRKYPHIFFVEGVDKARIYWDAKKRVVAHKYGKSVTDTEQRKKFAQVFNPLFATINNK